MLCWMLVQVGSGFQNFAYISFILGVFHCIYCSIYQLLSPCVDLCLIHQCRCALLDAQLLIQLGKAEMWQ